MTIAIDINDVFTPAGQPAWLTQLLALAAAPTVNLPATTFRPGDIARSLLILMSYAQAQFDATASLVAQGGFLDFAATGTVTYPNADGTTTTVPVSPDPADPEQNPDGRPTWLDVLVQSNFNISRILQTTAGGALAIVNTSVATYGPFAAGGYHVADPYTSAGYTNTASLTIAPSTVAGTSITNAQNNGGLIKITTSTNHGLTTDDAVFIQDVLGTTEANGAWYVTVLTATTFNLQGSTFANAYVSGGTVYVPTVATFVADVAGSASGSYNASGVLDVHTVTTAVTALVGVSVDNLDIWAGSDIENNVQLRDRARLKLQSLTTNGAAGAYQYYALASILYAPLLTPAQTVAVKISRVLVAEDKLTGHVTVFLANASGAPSTDDTNATDAVLQIWPRALGTTVDTLKATEANVAVAGTIYLPAAYATDANLTLFKTALQTYFQQLAIGGLSDPLGAYTNVVPYQDVTGVLYETAAANRIPLDNLDITLAGVKTNFALTVSSTVAEVAVLSPASPVIVFSPT